MMKKYQACIGCKTNCLSASRKLKVNQHKRNFTDQMMMIKPLNQ